MATLIIPGLHGSDDGHWQRHWLAEIPGAVLVEQADWDNPDLDQWLHTLAAAVRAHPGAVLVGHSLGAILIAHLAADYPELPIAAALLVAPADVDATQGKTVSFAPIPIAPFRFPSIVVASRNDPWMTADRARVLANLWESRFVDLGNAGHINTESRLASWPQGRALLASLEQAARRDWPRPPASQQAGAAFA